MGEQQQLGTPSPPPKGQPQDPKSEWWWQRIDAANFVPIASLIVSLFLFLWWSIERLDDDVDRLAGTVQGLAEDVGYIKGRLDGEKSVAGMPEPRHAK